MHVDHLKPYLSEEPLESWLPVSVDSEVNNTGSDGDGVDLAQEVVTLSGDGGEDIREASGNGSDTCDPTFGDGRLGRDCGAVMPVNWSAGEGDVMTTEETVRRGQRVRRPPDRYGVNGAAVGGRLQGSRD